MKEREITANLKDFSRETFSPLLLQKEFVPSLQSKMNCRRNEIAARMSKCIVDGIFKMALIASSRFTPGIQVKIPVTIVSSKQLTSSLSSYKETVDTLTLLCSELMYAHGAPGLELRGEPLLCPAPVVHHQIPCI